MKTKKTYSVNTDNKDLDFLFWGKQFFIIETHVKELRGFVFLNRKLNPETFQSDYIETFQNRVATFKWLSMTYFHRLIQKIHATVQSPTTWLQRAFLGYSIGMSPIS